MSSPNSTRSGGTSAKSRNVETTPGRVGKLVIRESDIQRTITDLLRAEGWRVFHFEDGFDQRSRKRKGEPGMPDLLCIRYAPIIDSELAGPGTAQVLWIELKRIDKRGRTTKASQTQMDWHRDERARGALVWVAGIDFPATIDGFLQFYRQSGLERR